jgi:hypothetical protein
VVFGEVADANHADRSAVADDREPTHRMPTHEGHSVLRILLQTDAYGSGVHTAPTSTIRRAVLSATTRTASSGR